MIPDFKTYLKESIWSDIHKRSNGVQIRKEDDYIDKLDFNEFIQYLDDTYESTDSSVENIDVHPSLNNPSLQLIQIPIEKIGERIPPVTINYQTKGTGFNGYDVEKPSCVAISSILFKSYPELVDNLEMEYDLEYPTLRRSYIVDTKSGPMKNSDCIKILDIVLSMVKEPVVIKKLGESVWADMHKRSNGSASKKEDYLDDIYNHIISKYKVAYVNMDTIEYKNGHIHIPLFKILPVSAYATVDIEMGYVNFSTINVNTYKSSLMKQTIKPFKNELNNLYDKIIDTYSPEISEFDGMQHWVDFKINKTTKEFCEEFIDFILNTVSDSNKSILKILEKK